MVAHAQTRFTEAEYLALSAASARKLEFIDGEIILWGTSGGGGSGGDGRGALAHNLITVNVAAELRARLRGRAGKVFGSGQRVWLEEGGAFVYPDVVVVCPPFETREGARDTFVAPRLVVEVLSPGSAGYRRKWPLYQSIASLGDVLLVEQAPRRVQHHRRVGPSEWLVRFVTEGEVTIEGIEVTLALDEIYAGVDALPR